MDSVELHAGTMDFVVQLRRNLKQWEVAFEEEHSRPPSRFDIKAVPEIAAQYKRYAKLRTRAESSISTPSYAQSKMQKARNYGRGGECNRQPETTSAGHTLYADKADESSDSDQCQQHHSSSNVQLELGPTPQHQGRILGLFEHLKEQEHEKQNAQLGDSQLISCLASLDPNIHTSRLPNTPSKQLEFAQYTTPEFLRTTALPSPTKSAQKGQYRKVKSLSTLFEELKCLERRPIDPGEEVLREIVVNEMNELAESGIVKPMHSNSKPVDPENTTVSEGRDQNSFKKVGQKRSHRRIKLRPTSRKPKADAQVNISLTKDTQYRDSLKSCDQPPAQRDFEEDAKLAPPEKRPRKSSSQQPGNFRSYKLRRANNHGRSCRQQSRRR